MTVSDPTDKESLSEAIADRYGTSSETTSWELCQQYQSFLEYTAEHPDAGRNRVSKHIADDPVPASRVRVWMNGGMPDAMRGIQACEARGWLDLTWSGSTLHNLAILIAWVFSGGSITTSWIPYLAAPDSDSQNRAVELLDQLGTRPELIREDDDGRVTEVRPTEASASLGRLLASLGAPTGHKNSQAVLSLPPWLADTPRDVRVAFARTYVQGRVSVRNDRLTTVVQMSEDRSLGFRRELQTFLNDVAGARVATGEGTTTYLQPAGAALFNQAPEIRG